ncbi:MAG: glycosyltransferase family 4 protein [Clostridia bacterium]|nr:glycosyltransferase family 4 protein [Clostridia bacterium]
MKVAFFSNFLNHHQLPLCREFCKKKNVEFTFIATEPISQDRLDMGYADMNKAYEFVLRAYENDDSQRDAEKLAKECDVMIFGAAPLSYLEVRMAENRLTFYFCERALRKGYWRRFIPMTYKKIYNAYLRYKDKPLYVLGASAYTSYDLKLCGFNEKKCFKWGYFPEIRGEHIDSLLERKKGNEVVEILYAGRLLHIKNVIDTVKALDLLIQDGIKNFHFTIIGDGEQKPMIEAYVQERSLQKYVTCLPFIPAEEVRKHMDKADIYVFGSNFFEGWGAVVNEAMDSACAMVVSHAVGSAPFLIKDGRSGLIYECGKIKQLSNALKKLIEDDLYRETLAQKGNRDIGEWTAAVACDRLLKLAHYLHDNESGGTPFSDGVCSLAEPIKNNWIRKKSENE